MNFDYHFVFLNKIYLLFNPCMGQFNFNQFLKIECYLMNFLFLMAVVEIHLACFNFYFLCLIISKKSLFKFPDELS